MSQGRGCGRGCGRVREGVQEGVQPSVWETGGCGGEGRVDPSPAGPAEQLPTGGRVLA